jgi:DNA-binding transcriptional LysR family regulator
MKFAMLAGRILIGDCAIQHGCECCDTRVRVHAEHRLAGRHDHGVIKEHKRLEQVSEIRGAGQTSNAAVRTAASAKHDPARRQRGLRNRGEYGCVDVHGSVSRKRDTCKGKSLLLDTRSAADTIEGFKARASAMRGLSEGGPGLGAMPLHMVKEDLERGTLLTIRVEGLPRDVMMPMKVVYRKDAPPGPATRAFIAQLAK